MSHNNYHTRILYEIIDGETGQVMDSIDELLKWPATAEQAMKHKYLLMQHIYSRGGNDEPELMNIVNAIS